MSTPCLWTMTLCAGITLGKYVILVLTDHF